MTRLTLIGPIQSILWTVPDSPQHDQMQPAGENISSAFVLPIVASCFDLVVHCHRGATGHRYVAEVLAIGNCVENGVTETYLVFRLEDGTLRCVASEVPSGEEFHRAGHDPARLIRQDGDQNRTAAATLGPRDTPTTAGSRAPRGMPARSCAVERQIHGCPEPEAGLTAAHHENRG